VRLSSRTALPIVAAAMLSSACGGGDQAVYTVPGHPPPASGPAITIQSAQQAIENRGADLFYNRQADNATDLDPRPVDSSHFGTADAGFFDLYVFADEAAARAAVGSARKLGTVEGKSHGRVVQVLNVIAVQPGNGRRSMVAAVEPGLRDLARAVVRHPNRPRTTTLRDNEDGSGQPQGPRG
jgi:hypothetical protein